MNILVSTADTQKARPSDYHWAPDGEPLKFIQLCGKDRSIDDMSCGCLRGFAGIDSGKGTTTALVTQSSMTIEEFVEKYVASEKKRGHVVENSIDYQESLDRAQYFAMTMLRVAASYPTGSVLEKRGDTIQPRRLGTGGVVISDQQPRLKP